MPRREHHLRIGDIVIILVLILVGSALSSLNVMGIVPRGFVIYSYAAIVLVIGYLGIKIIVVILERGLEPRIGVTGTRGTKNIFQIVATIAILVAIVAILGLNLTGVLVGAGFLGIVLGLAAQQVLGNLFAGLSLFAGRPFEIGERVTLSTSSYSQTGSSYPHENEPTGFSGVVIDIGIFYTRVMFDNGTPAVFPNSAVVASLVINHSRILLRSVPIRLDLDKSVPFEEFRARMLEALGKYDYIDASKSSVEIDNIGDKTYQVVIVGWTERSVVTPVKTVMMMEALEVQRQLQPPEPEPGAGDESGDHEPKTAGGGQQQKLPAAGDGDKPLGPQP